MDALDRCRARSSSVCRRSELKLKLFHLNVVIAMDILLLIYTSIPGTLLTEDTELCNNPTTCRKYKHDSNNLSTLIRAVAYTYFLLMALKLNCNDTRSRLENNDVFVITRYLQAKSHNNLRNCETAKWRTTGNHHIIISRVITY